jgi:hypothetical protein
LSASATSPLSGEFVDLPERILAAQLLGRRLGGSSEQELDCPHTAAAGLRLEELQLDLPLATERRSEP